MRNLTIDCRRSRFAKRVASFILAIAVVFPFAAYGGPGGIDIKIRAQNRSIADTPHFCTGIGAGLVGDRLDVDAFTDLAGNTTGTARFMDAQGNVTLINIDRIFAFFDGLVLQNDATQQTIAIWLSDHRAPAHVNVELPRGCGNTVSTFTTGIDKVTMQIKFMD
jgi:hypothetical protein